MDVRNCRRCGKMFAYVKVPICPMCEKKDAEDLEVVRKFIYDNPGCRIPYISEETGVPENQIRKYLIDGRLEVIESMSPMIECEVCGKPIHSGRYCNACAKKLGKEVSRGLPEKKAPVITTETKTNATMHLSKFKE